MKYVVFVLTLIGQFIVGYLFAFITLFTVGDLLGIGKSATIPDPLWAEVLWYAAISVALAIGMWLVGTGINRLRKQPAHGLWHFLGAAITAGLGWAWLESATIGQTRNPLLPIIAIFVGYYLVDIIGMFNRSGNASEVPAE